MLTILLEMHLMPRRCGGRSKEEDYIQESDIPLNNMKRFFLFLIPFSFMLSFAAMAQMDTVKIKTSAVCDQCKEKIEHDLSFEKGVKTAVLDLKTTEVTV